MCGVVCEIVCEIVCGLCVGYEGVCGCVGCV